MQMYLVKDLVGKILHKDTILALNTGSPSTLGPGRQLLQTAMLLVIVHIYSTPFYYEHPRDGELVPFIVRVDNSRNLFQSNVCNLFLPEI